MQGINTGRVVLGGLAAGLVMNVVDGITNGMVLGHQWQAEANALNPDLMTKAASTSTAGWITVDFLCGILLVWLYAAVRPRFGPGPRTALLTGFVLWVITHLIYSSYVFMGLFSASLIGASTLGGLIAFLAAGYLGGMLYRE